MVINSLDIVLYTSLFVLPGFITSGIGYMICPTRKMSDAVRLIKCIGYSLIDIAIWSWLYVIISGIEFSTLWGYYLCIVIAVFITSVINGICIGLFRHFSLIRKLLNRFFKIQVEKPIPTAWDSMFLDKKDGCWVIVSLGNGKHIGGRYSTKSYASSDAEYRDLFLEETYEVDEWGWKRIDNTEGVWISPSEIKKIEFIGDSCDEK